jgi:hypothetical protein
MNHQRTWFLTLTVTLGLAILAALLLMAEATAQVPTGASRYVAPTGVDSGACTNPGAPCHTVQYAVDQAAGGDEVRVASGVYTGVQARAGITQVVYISKTVAVRGGYRADFGAWDPEVYSTTLDAEAQGRVIYAAGPGITLTLEGLRLTNGRASGLGDTGGGLGVYNATTLVSGTQFVSNTASTSSTGYGGGMYQQGGSATLRGNWFENNTATTSGAGAGGGLYLASAATLAGNTFQSNIAVDGHYGTAFGGGVYLQANTYTVSGNTFTDNVANATPPPSIGGSGYGGGLYMTNCTATLRDNLFEGNRAAQLIGGGGGLYVQGGHVTVAANTLRANVGSASDQAHGGGMTGGGTATITVTGNMILSNTATLASTSWPGYGGGLDFINTNGYETLIVLISANTIQGNVAGGHYGAGGGVFLDSEILNDRFTLENNLIQGNTTGADPGGYGGGLYLRTPRDYTGHPSAWVAANILRDNTAPQGGGAYLVGGGNAGECVTDWANNVLLDNQAASGSALYFFNPYGNAYLQAYLRHTTLVHNTGGDGSAVYVDKSTVFLTNTLIYSHSVGVNNASGAVSLDTTLWDGVATPIVGVVGETGSFTGTAALAADSYHLSETSDAIDTGVYAGVGHDIDGERRPMGGGPDIGADEYPTTGVYLPLVLKAPTGGPGPTPPAR